MQIAVMALMEDLEAEDENVKVKKADVQLVLMIVDELINGIKSRKIENY